LEHAHIRKAGYGPPSQWPVGPQQAVDEESTCQTRMPMEDGHAMPFFLTRGVKSIIHSGGRVWRRVSEAAAAAEVAVMVMVLSSIFYVVSDDVFLSLDV
jgi:hypothetical protein